MNYNDKKKMYIFSLFCFYRYFTFFIIKICDVTAIVLKLINLLFSLFALANFQIKWSLPKCVTTTETYKYSHLRSPVHLTTYELQ